jgi:hypothetical protein
MCSLRNQSLLFTISWPAGRESSRPWRTLRRCMPPTEKERLISRSTVRTARRSLPASCRGLVPPAASAARCQVARGGGGWGPTRHTSKRVLNAFTASGLDEPDTRNQTIVVEVCEQSRAAPGSVVDHRPRGGGSPPGLPLGPTARDMSSDAAFGVSCFRC